MSKYVQVSARKFHPIADSCKYAGTILLHGTNLYVKEQAFEHVPEGGISARPEPGATIIRLKGAFERQSFEEFYNAFIANTLTWYRGFSISHFAYPDVRLGTLKSEGDADIPTFTMGNNDGAKTRWLPGCYVRDLSTGVGLNTEATPARVLAEKGHSVPVSVTVKVPIGVHDDRSVCWINSGEQLLRGPLQAAEFRICNVVWFKSGELDVTACDLGHADIPPSRPYKPSDVQMAKWWGECSTWIEDNYALHRKITLTKLNLSGLLRAR